MKKQILVAAIAASISMPSMADFLGIYAGIDYQTNSTKFITDDLDDTNNFSGYVAFEHFVPLLPNAKFKYADVSNDDLNDDSSAMNGILYYQLFDNGLFEFDFGLAYTRIESFNRSGDLAQAYGAAKVHIPGVGMHAFTEVIGGTFSDNEALDAEIGLAYTFNPDSNLLNIAVRAGYRVQEMELKRIGITQKTEGLFAGLEAHF